MSNLPAGYQLHITTWENDADNYHTQVMSGLSKEDVAFYVELAKGFRSKNSRPKGGLGNQQVDADTLVEYIDGMLAKHPNISEKVRNYWSTEDELADFDMALDDVKYDLYYEILCENVLGNPDDYYDHGFCRVFDEFKVLFVPEEVIIEDVTHQFK
jgi:hypothetical protein